MSTATRRQGWEGTALRWLEWVANPALAGLAFCLLCVGVVTWLPALAATAYALHRWRTDDEQQVFSTVLDSFGRYWSALWRHGLVSTLAVAVLVANLVFLAGRTSAVAFGLFAVQAGIAGALVPYHLSLAAVAARSPEHPGRWRRDAVVLAFGGWRGPVLFGSALAAVLLTLPLAVGPLLFGPTLPLLLALALAGRVVPDHRKGSR
jgi:hypothetical protein